MITALVLCFFAKANAQWQPDVRLTYWNSIKWNLYNNKWNIAAEPSGVLHVIWDDTRAGAGDIFYKRSSDNGTTWSVDVNLSNDMPGSGASCITSSGSNVYAAWIEFVGGSDEIFFKRSANSGNLVCKHPA